MRRLLWLAAGFGLGAAATRRAARDGRTSALATAAGGAATRVRRRVDGALADGRAEMHEREARLREAFGVPAPADTLDEADPVAAPSRADGTRDEVGAARRLRERGAGDRR